MVEKTKIYLEIKVLWGMLGKVEERERVIRMSPQSPFQGACQPWEWGAGVWGVWRFERNGKWDFVGNVLHSQGPGKRGGGCSAWVCANIVTVPKCLVLGTTPLTGGSVGKSKPGCSLLLHPQRQRGGVSAEASANLYKWNVLWVNKRQWEQ